MLRRAAAQGAVLAWLASLSFVALSARIFLLMSRPITPLLIGGGGGGSALADAGLLMLRLFAGLAIALSHGLGKIPVTETFAGGVAEMGFLLPGLFAWAMALAEFAGGLLLALGLVTRPASLSLLITMAVAAFVRHGGDSFGERELTLLYGAVALLFMLVGAGRFSVDALLRRRADRSYRTFRRRSRFRLR